MSIKLLTILPLLLALSGCAGRHWEPLTTEERQAQTAVTMLTVLDWKQTRVIADNGYEEGNPLLGRHPSRERVDTLIPLGILAQWVITYYLPHENRLPWQYLLLGCEASAVGGNYQAGIRIDF